MYTESNNKLPLMMSEKSTVLINFDETVKTIEREEETVTEYCYESVRILKTELTYSNIVSAIVTTKYSIDALIAQLANKDDGDEEHLKAYEEFESWRKHAKEIAKQVLNMNGENI